MLLDQNKGILYSNNFKVEKKLIKPEGNMPDYFEIPHKSLDFCKEEMGNTFGLAGNIDADYVFVLAPLHKGKINPDDKFCIYTYEDSFAEHVLLQKSDCVCSEEFSYEVALPYIKSYFPNAKSTAFFAPENSEELKAFISFLKTNYKKCVFFVSNNRNTNCSQMWKQAFQA